MSFKVSPRETISRCTAYDNKFRTYTEEPRLKDARKAQFAKDSVESDSARLEREMMNKFVKGMVSQEGTSVRFVKQVAKFVFVAVLYPPFMVAYMIPKWVVQYGLPFVADLTGNFMNKLVSGISPIASWAMQVSGMMIENFNKFFKAQFEKFYRAFKSSKDFIKQQFQKLADRVRSRVIKMCAPFILAYNYAHRKVSDRWARIKKWILNKAQLLSAKIKAIIAPWIPSKPTFPKISLAFAKVASWIKWIRERPYQLHLALQRTLKTVKEKAPILAKATLVWFKALKRFISIPKAIGGFFWEILRANYQGWIEPYIQWVVPACKWAKSQAAKAKDNVLNRIYTAYRALGSGLNFVSGLIWKGLIKVARPVKSAYAKSVSFIGNQASKLKFRVNEVGAAVKTKFVNFANRVVCLCFTLKDFATTKAISASKFIARLPKLALKVIKAVVIEFMLGVQQSLAALKSYYIFVKVLFRYGAYYIKTNWV